MANPYIFSISLFLLSILSIKSTCNRAQGIPSPMPINMEDKAANINGLTFVAPPEPFAQNPMPAVEAVNANWIAVVPYAFTRPGAAKVHYNVNGQHWWGERPEGILETIRLAQEVGIEVMLKPQVYMPGSWTGDLTFEEEASCLAWEKDYETYILGFAKMADTTGVKLFCLGTEFRKYIAQRPEFWFALIEKIRLVYHGKLTYSANWDDYTAVPFWEKLDYVGISAYFPLLNEKTPTIKALEKAWQPTVDSLSAFSKQIHKPILFTEYGYLSTDFCAWRNWEIEPKIREMAINEQAQANGLSALLGVFSKQDWWHGGFLWKWFPNGRGHEGYPERDYTPQGKAGEGVLQEFYKN